MFVDGKQPGDRASVSSREALKSRHIVNERYRRGVEKTGMTFGGRIAGIYYIAAFTPEASNACLNDLVILCQRRLLSMG